MQFRTTFDVAWSAERLLRSAVTTTQTLDQISVSRDDAPAGDQVLDHVVVRGESARRSRATTQLAPGDVVNR
ncbi:hypothetical protein J6590_082055 [Homalodisca vitripennis]|nr:hypothetical protein J6590_082055 [Homalodisca vitripennis]